jgi:hypothetical protein
MARYARPISWIFKAARSPARGKSGGGRASAGESSD